MAGAPPTDAPVNPVYYEALERQLATLRFVRTFKPFREVSRHFARDFTHDHGGYWDRRRADYSDEMDVAVAEGLSHAAPYFWTRHMCQLLAQTADSLPAWTLRPQDLATSAGYLWFQEPLPILDEIGKPVVDGERLRALSWCAVERMTSAMGIATGGGSSPNNEVVDLGYMVVAYTVYEGGTAYTPYVDVAHGTPRTPLMWKLGQTLQEFQAGLERLYADTQFRQGIRAVAGMPPNFHRQQMVKFGRYFAAAVALMNQTLVTTSHYRGDRAARRRVKAITPPTVPDPEVVRAVELRRRQYVKKEHDPDHEPERVDWSCQWTVRPHWREQWYPSEDRHKSILIGSYVKGPPDKPLKAVGPLFWVKR